MKIYREKTLFMKGVSILEINLFPPPLFTIVKGQKEVHTLLTVDTVNVSLSNSTGNHEERGS